MAEEKKSIKIAVVILLIMLIFALVYSLIALIKPDVFITKSYQGYTDKSWSDLVASSPKEANYAVALQRLAAGFGFTVVIAGFFVLLTAFKRGEKWAWYYILIVSLVGWLTNLIFSIFAKNPTTIIMNIVGIVLFLVGVIIPAKDFLSK